MLKKFILARATAIQNKEALKLAEKTEKAKKESELRQEAYLADRKVLQNGIRVLHEVIDARARTMENIPCHVKAGDTAILNIYSLGYSGSNSWDGGPQAFLSCITDKQEIDSPVIVQITEVYVDKSLAYDKIEHFIEREMNFNDLKTADDAYIRNCYQKYVGASNNTDYFLYKTAKFNNNTTFQPQWGLNVKSFIPKSSPDFKKTYDIWREEIELAWRNAELRKKLQEIELRKIQMQAEIRDHRNLFN